MKKIVSMALAAWLCLTLLTACDLENIEAHEHEFDTEWSTDEDRHWYACKSEACPERSESALHTMEETEADGSLIRTCTVCAYSVTQTVTAAPHEHTASDTFSTNENSHWYACTAEHCTEKLALAQHQWDDPKVEHEAALIRRIYTCKDCSYEKTETTEIQNVVENEVDWKEAFENLEFVNYSLTVKLDGMTNYVRVDDDCVYYKVGNSREFYSVKRADQTYTTYMKTENGYVVLQDTTDTYWNGATTSSVIRVSFADHFDQFTFDAETGTYFCQEPIGVEVYDFNGNSDSGMYCYHITMKVADGKIISIRSDYYFDWWEDGETAAFEYTDIGMTYVSVPDNIVATATPEKAST